MTPRVHHPRPTFERWHAAQRARADERADEVACQRTSRVGQQPHRLTARTGSDQASTPSMPGDIHDHVILGDGPGGSLFSPPEFICA